MRCGLSLLLLITMPCYSQTISTGRAETTGSCSPAVSGSNNQFQIRCTVNGKEQSEKTLVLLNKILANQPDFDAIMSKLDECLKGIPQHRHLTEQQKTALRAATIFPPGLIAVTHVNDLEAKKYADEIKEVLGVKTTSNVEMTDEETYGGIRVGGVYNNTDLTFYNYAERLAREMTQADFAEVSFKPSYSKSLRSGFAPLWISIGFAPSTQ